MTLDEAFKVRVPFGKHRDAELGTIYDNEPDYLLWLTKPEREIRSEELAEALKIIHNECAIPLQAAAAAAKQVSRPKGRSK